jgi:hypothetical protein
MICNNRFGDDIYMSVAIGVDVDNDSFGVALVRYAKDRYVLIPSCSYVTCISARSMESCGKFAEENLDVCEFNFTLLSKCKLRLKFLHLCETYC